MQRSSGRGSNRTLYGVGIVPATFAIGALVLLISAATPAPSRAQPADYPASCAPGGNDAQCSADLKAQTARKCVAAGGRMTNQGSFMMACVFPTPGSVASGPNRQQRIIQGTLGSASTALGVLADEEAQRQADAEAAQAQADAEEAARRQEAYERQQQAAAADAQRRAGLSNPFSGGAAPVSADNPFAAPSGGQPTQVASADGNPFGPPPPPTPKQDANNPQLAESHRPAPGTYPATSDTCDQWGGWFSYPPNTPAYNPGDPPRTGPPIVGTCVVRAKPRQYQPEGALGVRG
jgi:hypothetical protein